MSEASLPREILHREGFYPEESSGLFVGISSFVDDSFAAVPYAVDDAVDLAWVFVLHLQLVDPRRTVLALAGEPRKQISRERLDALLQAGARRESAGLTQLHRLVSTVGHTCGPRGLFVLTVATHGLSDPGGDYLVATDTLRDGLLDTALKLSTLFDRIAQLPAKRRLVLLDTCRERMNQQRSVAEADPAMAASFAAAISKAVGQTVLMASVAGGYSYDDTRKQNGVFSGALVDGLCGAAQADSEGWITVGAVAEYAQERVQAFVREHRPKHVSQSRGIEERYEEKARSLPLAIDPARTRALDTYRARLEAAVEQLHKNIGGDLDGRQIEDIKDFLPATGPPNAQVEKLLQEIEALDGSDRSKRSVLFLFEKLRAGREGGEPESQTIPASTSPWITGAWVKRAVSAAGAGVGFGVFVLLLMVWFGALDTKKPEPIKKTISKEPQAGDRVLDSFGMAYRYIPGGTYTIGSPPTEPERFEIETQHEVSVKGFWLAETEMTQTQWKRHGIPNPSGFSTCANCPVERVSWFEVVLFANRLSTEAGLQTCYVPESCTGDMGTSSFQCVAVTLKEGDCEGYRLPMEQEWEVAALAQLPGTAYRARYGELDAIAWYSGNSGMRSHPVGTKTANAWGLHDMLGNVWEWTNSNFMGSARVFRGGSWLSDAGFVRAAQRDGRVPTFRDDGVGFRFLLGRPRPSLE